MHPRCARHAPPIWVGILAIITFFMEISVSSTLLAFFVEDELHRHRSWVGIVYTCQYVGAAVGLVLSGVASDRLGARPTLIILLATSAILFNVQGWVRSVHALVAVRVLVGLANPYALGLAWVAKLAPPERLARWMAVSVALAQASTALGGLVGGFFHGATYWAPSAILSAFPLLGTAALLGAREVPARIGAPAGDLGAGPSRSWSTLWRAVSRWHFLALVFSSFAQASLIGAIGTVLMPLLLKDTHGWSEQSVSALYNVVGVSTLIAHLTLTAWLSSRPWRAHAMQCLSLLIAALLVAIGWLGERSSAAAFALFAVAYVCTAVCLGIGNLMVALYAKAAAPALLTALTGLTRCFFMVGFAMLPATIVPLTDAAGILLPCCIIAGLFVAKAAVMQAAARPVAPLTHVSLAASTCITREFQPMSSASGEEDAARTDPGESNEVLKTASV